jgi:PAS domain S-box-containing protein
MQTIVDFIVGVALFINAMLFIPQALRIYLDKSAKDISLVTFSGFIFINSVVAIHGYLHHDYILTVGYLLSAFACASVVMLSIYYRYLKHNTSKQLSLVEVIEQLPGHLFWKNADGQYIGFNGNQWKNLGLTSADELKNKTDHQVLSKKEADTIVNTDKMIMASRESRIIEEIFTNLHGKTFLYLSHKSPLIDKNNNVIGVIGIAMDITQIKRQQLDQLYKLKSIIAMLPGHVYWKNKEGVYEGCNDRQAQSLGLSRGSQVIGKTDFQLPWGEQIAERFRENDIRIMQSGNPAIFEEPVNDNGKKIIMLSQKAPLYNLANEMVGMVGISIDITKQKEAEKRERDARANAAAAQVRALAEEELRQSVMILAGSIAHDMRTPLATIQMLSNITEKLNSILLQSYHMAFKAKLPGLPTLNNTQKQKAQSISKDIAEVVSEMNDYINISLNSLGRVLAKDIQPEDLVKCSADYCIHNTVKRYPFNTGERERIHIDSEYQFDFMGNQLLLFRVLSNLIKNSLHEINKEGIGDIFIATRSGDEMNEIVVRDTAGSLSEEDVSKLFNGYYTTKKQGTGVGLAFCKITMESFGGNICCKSDCNQYIEFILSFPKIKN